LDKFCQLSGILGFGFGFASIVVHFESLVQSSNFSFVCLVFSGKPVAELADFRDVCL
jgi:hypothetical protein